MFLLYRLCDKTKVINTVTKLLNTFYTNLHSNTYTYIITLEWPNVQHNLKFAYNINGLNKSYWTDKYHADLCRHKVAEPVEPLYVSLQITRFLVITETSLKEIKCPRWAKSFRLHVAMVLKYSKKLYQLVPLIIITIPPFNPLGLLKSFFCDILVLYI